VAEVSVVLRRRRGENGARPAGRFVAIVGALGLLLAACPGDADRASEERLEAYREDGVVIGIAPEPPYGFEENGQLTGASPELAGEVLDRIGVEVEDYVVTDFGFLVDGLVAERIDVIAGGAFVTPERARRVLFADPDYCAFTAFAVPEGNPAELDDYASVVDAGIVLGVVTGTVEQDAAPQAGVDQIEEFATNAEAFEALEAGEVGAVALTSFTVDYETEQMSGFEATEGFIPVIDGQEQIGCGAFGFRHEDQALRDAFNDELAAMQEAGEVLPLVEPFGSLVEPFGFDQRALDRADGMTAAELAGEDEH
jgi:polar amino acid transport system substrate-binding protein